MSYNYPYQNYQPSAFPPPPPPPQQSSASSYGSAQKPALPPRPPPTPTSPNVQDLTTGFARLSTQQTYIPHAEYHQATSNYTWPTTHGASLSSASQAEYQPPPPLPPRPGSQSPWQGSWQAPQSPPPPPYTPHQTWQQPSTPQSPWTAPSNQSSPRPASSQWQQNGTYNRPPPPPPAELQPRPYAPPCKCAWGPQTCYAHPKSSTNVSPVDSWSQGTPASSPAQSSYPQNQQQQEQPQQQTYYQPPIENNLAELPSDAPSHFQEELKPVSPPHSAQIPPNRPPNTQQPQPGQFVFEMEGSTPGMSEEKRPSEEGKKAESNKEPVPGKIQRTFTDTLRQAGPFFYAPPVPSAVQEMSPTGEGQFEAKQSGETDSPNAIPNASAGPELDAGLDTDNRATYPQDPANQNRTEQPFAGAIPSCYYLKIPNPPTNILAEQAHGYFVAYRCDYPEINNYADVFWFNHIDVPDFRACGYCFEKHIRNTVFASSFTGRVESKDLKLKCSFGAPRMITAPWPQALRTRDLGQVKEYMEKLVRITHCHGVSGVLGKDDPAVQWFTMKDNEVPGFLACGACLEERVVGTPFQKRFVPYSESQGPDQKWSCDLAVEYLRRGFAHYLKMADWSAFVSIAARRLSLPACEGAKGVMAGSRKWYAPTRPIQGVVICEACYVDHFGFTEFERDFVDYPVPREVASNQWSCDTAPISVKNAIEASKRDSDFTILHTTLSSLATNPVCTTGAISSKTWYNLSNNTSNFDVCPTCFTGLFACIGLSHLFRAATTAQPTQRICDLSPHSPRFKEYAFLYLAAINTPTGESAFVAHVSRFATIPACARRDPARNRRWHLLNGLAADLVCCDECHATFVEKTALAYLLTPWPPTTSSDSDPVPRVCDMYSANMRARWTQLCATSLSTTDDPSTSPALAAFVRFAQHRHRVYDETVPQCRELVQAAQLRREQHRMAADMSSHYHAMGLMTGGTGYGGWGMTGYGGLYGGQAAAAGAQGVGLMMEMQADMRKVAVLEGRWKEVE